MTTNQTIDGVPRRICHACVTYPRDAYCPVCDPAAQPQGEPVAFIQIPKNIEKYGHGDQADRLSFGKPGQFFVNGESPMFDFVLLYTEQPAPVAPTPINYGALDPVERLAVCRGEVAPVADAWPRLEKPAKVGPGRFQVGVSSRLVVEAAQRHYEYEVTPGKEAIRIAQAKELLAQLSAPVVAVLPERMSLEKTQPHTAPVEIHNGVVTGWNACLDELKRLNGIER